jgi:hypothetical protein
MEQMENRKRKGKENKKKEKRPGHHFGLVAKAGPARYLPEPNRYAAPQRSH